MPARTTGSFTVTGMRDAAGPDDSGFVPFIDMIAAHAASNPDGAAFREEERTLDWQTLHARVLHVASSLAACGVRAGDRVAVLGHPSLAHVECVFGTIAARACIVPLPASATLATLEAMLADCDARLLFVDPAVAEAAALAERFASRAPSGVVRFGEAGSDGSEYAAWRERGAARPALPKPQPDDAFNIIYSSGTTGMPKGIVHLHGMRQQQARRNLFGFGPQCRTLLSTPMYSNTTITPMLGTLAHGGECILMRKFDAGRYLAIAGALRVTHTMLVPVQYARLLAHPDFDRTDLSAFQLSQSTGAPMDAACKRDVLARWPGRFIEVYGMTEGGPTCLLDARQHPGKLATVGKPAPGSVVFLIDDAGRKLSLPEPGGAPVTGEVVGRSPLMMAGYHNRPDAMAEICWFDEQGRRHHRTGDIGRFDDDGFLTLLDRRKDVIISGGNNIYAADLEAVLARHPDVQESAVVGIPSAAWGETPLAIVVAKPGTRPDSATLLEWANAQLGKTQRLAAIEFRGELPRSALGKLSKKELRAPYWKNVDPPDAGRPVTEGASS